MSDGTANYVNKEYGYAKLLWDFQKLDVPMRHLGGQGDSLIERRRKRRCGHLNQTLHRLAFGSGDVARAQRGSVSSLKSVVQN